jgi:hypothetical protein
VRNERKGLASGRRNLREGCIGDDSSMAVAADCIRRYRCIIGGMFLQTVARCMACRACRDICGILVKRPQSAGSAMFMRHSDRLIVPSWSAEPRIAGGWRSFGSFCVRP